MAREPFLTRGVVLRETQTKETDKILTLLTAEHGRLSVVAKGARKKGSRYAACAQPLAYGEWTLTRRGVWCYAREGEPLELFPGLRADLERLALASYCAELAEAVAVEDQSAEELLRHLLNALYALSALEKPPELVKPAFELRLLCLAGYEPLLDACAICGREEPDEAVLDIRQGVLFCGACAPGDGPRFPPLCRDALAAARRAVDAEARRLYAYRLDGAPRVRFRKAAEAFLLAQLDRRFRTLDYYNALRAPEADAGQAYLPETGRRTEGSRETV